MSKSDFFFEKIWRTMNSTLFPYTTLFRSRINGGIAMTGVAFNTRLRAVSATARVAAFLLLPRLAASRSEEHTSELQSHVNLVCRLLLEKKKRSGLICLARSSRTGLDMSHI